MKKLLILLFLVLIGCVGIQKSPWELAEESGTKVSDLSALGAAPAAVDVVPIVDVSDTTMAASGTTKKITVANLEK